MRPTVHPRSRAASETLTNLGTGIVDIPLSVTVSLDFGKPKRQTSHGPRGAAGASRLPESASAAVSLRFQWPPAP